jgi:hypothetical protein
VTGNVKRAVAELRNRPRVRLRLSEETRAPDATSTGSILDTHWLSQRTRAGGVRTVDQLSGGARSAASYPITWKDWPNGFG